MQEFFIYDVLSGEVVQTGGVPISDIDYQTAPDGYSVGIGHADIGQRYINGELID